MYDADLDRADLIRGVEKAVATQIAPLRAALESHTGDPFAHPQAQSEERRKLDTLWDERQELRGAISVMKVMFPIMSVLGPIVAVALAHWWK